MSACSGETHSSTHTRPAGAVPVRSIQAAPASNQLPTLQPVPTMPAAAAAVVSLPWPAALAYLSPLVPVEDAGAQVHEARFFQPILVQAVDGAVPVVLGPDPICLEAAPREHTPGVPPAQNPFGAHPASPKDGTDFSLALDLGLGWHRGAAAWWVAVQSREDLAAGLYRFDRMDAKLAALPPSMEAVVNIMLPERRLAPDRWEVAPGREVYAEFIKTLVTRYARRVRYWQFENEPDLGPGAADLPGFAQLHTFTAGRIRAWQPDARLLFAGFTGLGGEAQLARQLEQVAGRVGTGDAQIFDLHTYGGVGGWMRLDGLYAQLRARLDAAGLGRAAIWMTETGTWTGAPGLPGPAGPPGLAGPAGPMGPQSASVPARLPFQSERDQARELVKRYVHGFFLGIERIFWAWGIKEGFHDRDQMFDVTGLVYDGRGEGDPGDNIPKLGYFAYKRLIRAMLGREGGLIRLDLGPGVHAYQFDREGTPVIIAWKE
ncbi:hypothetical protein DGI_2685 [Megalodesulfovibrio gigas DSM 1382 = ATCC 19364]|uniref:Glycoside hydrolase family 5 domain-containing protein n=2 Tax=Megalodesulfovibrio gigas TaxID=879 RepID=T2GE61_MEGG1|nr:hypothetical protein [Megalodesulfovibrio gigas]AGW14416.1 hypothetical protein DGI_2685 [Megalodesulfovibrio gigas DSM 1382 = ATCC 19364]